VGWSFAEEDFLCVDEHGEWGVDREDDMGCEIGHRRQFAGWGSFGFFIGAAQPDEAEVEYFLPDHGMTDGGLRMSLAIWRVSAAGYWAERTGEPRQCRGGCKD